MVTINQRDCMVRPSALHQQAVFNAESCGSNVCSFLSFVSLIILFISLLICGVCVYIFVFIHFLVF